RARRAAGVTVDRLHTVMPTPGEIFGYMLDTLFTDQIYGDLEQLERINTLVHSAPQAARGERPIETLMLAPSVDPREIALRHLRAARRPRGRLKELGARQAAVARGDVAEFAGELLGQAVDDVHRAVLAAGASDRHREVAAVARLVLRHAAAHEARDVRHQRRHVGVGLEETDDLGIAAGEVAQARLPVGVGERPRVEHEIG